MSDALKKQQGWDAPTEANRAFALTSNVRAVIFCSDVATIKRSERRPARRLHEKLLRQIEELIRSGKHDEARRAIDQTSWTGPQTIWWASSILELTKVIEHHDDIIRKHKIVAGVSVEEFLPDPEVVFFHCWRDQ
jgi:hypothetical protein